MEATAAIGEGISAVGWSPDGELVAFYATGEGKEPSYVYLIVCHGSRLQPLTHFTFSTTEFGEGMLIAFLLSCRHCETKLLWQYFHYPR